jgi:hypothetical protein
MQHALHKQPAVLSRPPERFDHTAVILSEAKDLMPVANGDEVLRFAQDDRFFLIFFLALLS